MTHIDAPFTPEQVEALNQWQESGWMHPFTCARRGDGRHRERDDRDLGQLIATEAGWVCLDCDYEQDWAHDFMAEENLTEMVNVPRQGGGE